MEVRRLRDVLLRSRPPILPFLTPHGSARSWPPYQSVDVFLTSRSSQPYPRYSRKTFASSSNARTTPTPVSELEYESGTNKSRLGGGYPRNNIDAILEEFIPPKEKSASARAPPYRYGTDAGLAQSTGNSATDVLSGLRAMRGRGRVEVSKMIDPKPAPSAPASVSEAVPAGVIARTPRPQIRLGPSVGRSVTVEAGRGVDLGRAFRNLDINCVRNTVKGDFMRQRFHERPGLKRKRLRSVRWRKRFKEGFRAMVNKVEEMRRSGW